MTNLYTHVNLPRSRFVGYTKERLVLRHSLLSQIIMDEHSLDIEIEEAAQLRREVKSMLDVFAEMEGMGVDVTGVTAADILEEVSDQSIERLQKQTAGGILAQDMVEQGTKKLNQFGSWLSSLGK